ncbi:MAG: insulinase family protein [bacterium]|nr:insulinase family protein [bacterium]
MIKKTILDCGLVVISEYIPAHPSFALSYTLRTGSRTETTDNAGIFHCIEHLMFKGTTKYDLKEIADISDRLGGRLNALTSKEITQFYLKAIDEKLAESFELLTEIVMNSTFPADEFQKEISILLQEINETEDNPDTFAFETFYEDVYQNNGLGYPIGGKEDVVGAFERHTVFEFYKKHYTPNNLVLSAVGKIRHDELVDMAQKAFHKYPARSLLAFAFETPSFRGNTFFSRNDSLNQLYSLVGFDSLNAIAPDRHRFSIMNDILGSGMSSRLFQKIREEEGLAYTVSSFTDSYLDCGLHMIYSIVERDKIQLYLEEVRNEILRLKKDGITEQELERSKDHIKASVIMGLEGSVSRMRFHVNQELNEGRDIPISDIIADIENATKDDIDQLARKYLDLDKAALFLYGDVDENMELKL